MENDVKRREIGEFVPYVMARALDDSRFRAAFRHAAEPAYESGVWEYEMDFIDISDKTARRILAIIGSAVALSGRKKDGTRSLGGAFREVSREGEPHPRFRQLLAVRNINDLLSMLYLNMRFLESRDAGLSYGRLLKDLFMFRKDPESVKVSWTKDFFTNECDEMK